MQSQLPQVLQRAKLLNLCQERVTLSFKQYLLYQVQTQWSAHLVEMLDGVGMHVQDLKLQKSTDGIGLVASRGNVPQLSAYSEHTDPSYLGERCQSSVNMKQLAV